MHFHSYFKVMADFCRRRENRLSVESFLPSCTQVINSYGRWFYWSAAI